MDNCSIHRSQTCDQVSALCIGLVGLTTTGSRKAVLLQLPDTGVEISNEESVVRIIGVPIPVTFDPIKNFSLFVGNPTLCCSRYREQNASQRDDRPCSNLSQITPSVSPYVGFERIDTRCLMLSCTNTPDPPLGCGALGLAFVWFRPNQQ